MNKNQIKYTSTNGIVSVIILQYIHNNNILITFLFYSPVAQIEKDNFNKKIDTHTMISKKFMLVPPFSSILHFQYLLRI